jgi:hypothetical protein
MAVDYLKTYLGIDPDDYSSMEARIRGEEPQAQAPVMMRQPMMMPQQRSLGEMEAMPMAPRSQPTPQVDDRYQSLMDEIASLKAQIDALQTPEPMPVVDQTPVATEDRISDMLMRNPDGTPMTGSTGQEAFYNDDGTRKTFLAPPELQNRMVEEPQPIPQAPSQDIQASIDYLAKLPKMNIPQIPDMEQIRQKMEEANMTFPEPVSYQDQLQSIKDLPPMTQMPTREEIQTAMQNIPTPIGANVTNPFQKINDILPQSTIDQFQAVASKPNPFVPQQMPQQKSGGIFGNLLSRVQKPNQMPQKKSSGIFGNLSNLVKKQVQQPQMQSVGRPQLPFQGGFMPEMRADGGGIDKAIYDLKFKLNG